MKVIELLTKIANKEELPTYIKVKDSIFGVSCKFNGHDLDYQLDTLDNEEYYLSDYICKGGLSLNDEIEIIEDNKIEKIDLSEWSEITYSEDWKLLTYDFNRNCNLFVNKINKIIDKITELETE